MKKGEALIKIAFYSQTMYAEGPYIKMSPERREEFKQRAKRRIPGWVGGFGAVGGLLGGGLTASKGGAVIGGLLGGALGGGLSALEHKNVDQSNAYRGEAHANYDFKGTRAKANLKELYKRHYASIKDPESKTILRGMNPEKVTKQDFDKSQGKVKLRSIQQVYY